jgi:hypothetical protein
MMDRVTNLDDPVSHKRSAMARVTSRETWAFAWSRTWNGSSRNLWWIALFGVVLLPTSLAAALSAATLSVALVYLGAALFGAVCFLYWLLGRPGDSRDLLQVFFASKPRIAGGLYSVALAGITVWLLIRLERLIGGSPRLEARALGGLALYLMIVAGFVAPKRLRAGTNVQGILAALACVAVAVCTLIALRGHNGNGAEAWTLPVVTMVCGSGAVVCATKTARNTIRFRVL